MRQFKLFYLIPLLFLTIIQILPANAYSQMPSPLYTVQQTTVSPYNEVCFLRIKRKRLISSSYFVSTGFFIAPNVVLTAAHNIHSAFNSKVAAIEIVPGKYFDNRPFGNLIISGKEACETAIRTHPSYSFSDNWSTRIQWDFGIIIIPQNILTENSTLQNGDGFTLDSNVVTKVGDTIRVAGYPR